MNSFSFMKNLAASWNQGIWLPNLAEKIFLQSCMSTNLWHYFFYLDNLFYYIWYLDFNLLSKVNLNSWLFIKLRDLLVTQTKLFWTPKPKYNLRQTLVEAKLLFSTRFDQIFLRTFYFFLDGVMDGRGYSSIYLILKTYIN